MSSIPGDMSPSPSSEVVVLRCEDYDESRVLDGVSRGIDLLGGPAAFVQPGERLLLKPNLLTGKAPERSVTTHPSVFHAAARVFLDAGATLSYGDSPGFGRMETVARRSGIAAVAESLSIAAADFRTGRAVSWPQGAVIKQFTIAAGALEADGIISLPKLKTHALTRLTGAVKNQFGCIPGMLKGEFHARMQEMDRFAGMLVDLTALLRPRLYIMDAVVAMEGNGPNSGPSRPLHALLFSRDPVALDTVACRLVNLDPALVPTIVWGERNGLGHCADIPVAGDDLSRLICKDFKVNRKKKGSADSMPKWLSWLMKQYVVPRPVITQAQCTQCGSCVKVCPLSPKAVDFQEGDHSRPPRYDYNACIRCYCCQEMCPEGAITVETPRLGRLIHR